MEQNLENLEKAGSRRRFGLIAIASLFLLASCSIAPLKPGRATFSAADGSNGFVVQSQNPQAESNQKYEKIYEPVYVKPYDTVNVPQVASVNNQPVTNYSPGPGYINTRVTERIETHIGASQKDTGRELSVKLKALSGVVWIGVLVFLFGAASLVWPPLKAIVASTTTSVVITAAGLALIILPSLIVGHEVLILAIGGGAAIVWWFAHRHGQIRGALNLLKPPVK